MKEKKFTKSAPHLPVKDLRQTLDYYREVLGFYDEWTWINRDGNITDGGIRRDEMRLLFGEDPEFTGCINNGGKRLPLLWFVDNIEAVYTEFTAKNIPIAGPLETHSYGLKEFAFIDVNGYYIRVAEEA